MNRYHSLPPFPAKLTLRSIVLLLLMVMCRFTVFASTALTDSDTIAPNKESTLFQNTQFPSTPTILHARHGIGEGYDPDSPGNPSNEDKKKHSVTVTVLPSGAGSVSPVGRFDMEESDSRLVYAYPNNGWGLTGWTVNGEPLQTTTSPISITMGEKDLNIVANFSYDPASPSNPGTNYYDPTTGQVIIDDFTSGDLYDVLSDLVGYRNFANITSLIVKGKITSNDLGDLDYLSNAETIDISRTGGISELPNYAFSSTGATNIVLPSTISSFGNYVFRNCNNLTTLTLYAQEPPTCNSNTFNGFTNKANCIVYVPKEAIELYMKANYWKDFKILPILTDAHVLQVNLPGDASDGRYKNNSLEIVNINSGVRQKYVISDRLLYTFNGLQKDEKYNIYMFSQAGLEIGRIENVVIPDQDIEVTFDNLKSLHTVYAKVMDTGGSDVTSQVTVEWFKPLADGTTTYLRKAVSLGEIPDGQQLLCRVSLDNKLGVVYANPDDVEFTVGAGNNTCTVTLAPFRSIELSGSVVDDDGAALSGASVSVNQTLNGRYSKTYTTKTDRKGLWNLSVLDAPETRLTYAASECINVNDTIGTFAADINALDLGKKALKSIVGARITYGFTYHATGSEDVQDYYSDYQNVAISVFNVTQNRDHKDLSLQYPILAVLDENINVGDKLKLTITSKTGTFNPIVETVTIGDNQRAEVTFDIVGKGGISASFEMTDNPAVIAMLYSAKGELLKKVTYSEAKATFTELEDGEYTLVSMGQSDFMSSILRLSNYDEIGLTEGKDYVKNTVKVETGKLAEVIIPEVPAFDESLFYYTNSNTSFTVNKSSVTTGNYLTLRSVIDFKDAYENDISNVSLIVDLPEACDFVEQSVIQGPNLLPYTLDNNRLTVQLSTNYQTQIRFCVIPTNGGSLNATASIIFDYNGKTVTQPIGSAVSEIKDIEISVPSVITGKVFKVSGIAVGNSTINIYEDGTVLGNGKANSAGSWNVECELSNPYNLSTHSIYAEITTPDGNTLTSETKTLTYDVNAILVSKVTMYHWNPELNGWKGRMEISEFDFLNPKRFATQWIIYYPKKQFTYTIEFTDNDPECISNVILYVHTADGRSVPINASFDENKGMWYAEIDMGTSPDGYYPVNCSVDFDCYTTKFADRVFIDSQINSLSEDRNDLLNEVKVLESIFDSDDVTINGDEQLSIIKSLLSTDDYDFNKLSEVITDLIYGKELSQEVDQTMVDTEYQILISEYDEWLLNYKSEIDSIFSAFYIPTSNMDIVNIDKDMEYRKERENAETTIYRSAKINNVNHDELILQGYDYYSMTDNSIVYYQYTEDSISFIDTNSFMRYDIFLSVENNNSSPLRAKSWLQSVRDCAKGIAFAVRDLSQLKDNQTNQDMALSFLNIASDLMNATQCAYAFGLIGLRGTIVDRYDNAVEKVNKKIANRQKTINNLYSDMNIKRGQLSSLKTRMSDITREADNLSKLLENGNLDELTKLEYRQRIEALNYEWRLNANAVAVCESRINKTADQILILEKQIGRLNIEKLGIDEGYRLATKNLNKLPANLTRGIKLGKTITIIGKLAGPFGVLVQAINIYSDCADAIDEVNEWIDLYNTVKAKIPCENNESAAEDLLNRIERDKNNIIGSYGSILLSEASGLSTDIVELFQPELFLPCFFISSVCNIYAEWSKLLSITNKYIPKRGNYWKEYGKLRCGKKQCGEAGMPPCPPPPGGGGGNPGGGGSGSGSPNDNVQIDPSGFVYEAVPENRVEGVQATIYYKETKEDMYGDPYEEIVLWDAEEYAQKNPLFTDENGMYRWDVPQGLWQVKFEKDGYQTAYSEWLPVPPPQLEVNIGIVQNKQPEVTEARAYEEGVEVQFDKFMDLSTLTTDNIYVTANGEKLNGEIRLIDSALADEYASEDDVNATRYASRVRFVPNEKLGATTGEIRLTVSRNVLSYAGIPMTETFSQVLDVEKEVQVVYADDVKVLYGGEKEVIVYALPYEAAVGRKLHIANSSDLIASIDITEAILDEEGKAVVKVKGDLPGRAQLSFTIDDVTATGGCAVDVVTEIITAEAPKSSRASGTAVYRGTKVELTTESKNATIYFTTDGSCPCDENGTRRKYTVPIIINDDTQILAITSVGNGDDEVSETVQFNYTLKRSDMDFRMEEGWTWMSHNFESGIAPAELAGDDKITRILSQTKEVIRDPQLGMIGTLTELSASESYKVETTASTTRQRMSDIAWNPSTPIALNAGWNWLGYPVSQTMSVDEAFETTKAETLDVVVGQNGFAQFDGEKWIGTLETMSPGMGYMYQSQSAKNVVYNTSIVSTASAKYTPGISANSPLVLDIHKYGVIMPVVATITDTDGLELDNGDYQVAAFCGSECRGIGRIVNGLVMMNVYGNVNDPITFRVTDADGETGFANNASLNFSEKVVGDIFSPYAISINTHSGIADVKYDGNIKVTVDGDMLRIEGIPADAINFVEVYDINGWKLIHETHVSESGIRISTLTNGAYVVIVNGNGEYTYHKIAVR